MKNIEQTKLSVQLHTCTECKPLFHEVLQASATALDFVLSEFLLEFSTVLCVRKFLMAGSKDTTLSYLLLNNSVSTKVNVTVLSWTNNSSLN